MTATWPSRTWSTASLDVGARHLMEVEAEMKKPEQLEQELKATFLKRHSNSVRIWKMSLLLLKMLRHEKTIATCVPLRLQITRPLPPRCPRLSRPGAQRLNCCMTSQASQPVEVGAQTSFQTSLVVGWQSSGHGHRGSQLPVCLLAT